jgi:hypothetical protein
MVEKLGIAKLPSLVEFKRGKIARSEFVQDGESAKKFLS